MRLLHKFATISLTLLILACTNPFNPALRSGGTTREFSYPNDSPDNVLRNLMLAYNQKSIEIYKATLDKDFRFHVASWNAPEIGQDWWGYEQEIEFHRNLFSQGSSDGRYPSPDKIILNLEIPPASMWQKDPQIGHENWIIISAPFHLQLSYVARNDIAAMGFARFHLRPVDGRWYIAIWVDESF